MRRQLKTLFALVLSLLLAVAPAIEGFAEGAEEAQVEATVEATAEPTEEATVEPTEEITVEPTEEITVEPTEEVTVEPTEEITVEPTEEVTVEPTEEVTVEPTEEVTVEPTKEVTVEPTEEVTVEPTEEMTVEPTEEATAEPEALSALAALSLEHPAFDLDKNDTTMTATVIGYDDSAEKAVTIPTTSDGYTIVAIMGSAFAGTAITSVSIPDSVTAVGADAFENCGSLTTVTFGSGVLTIGAGAFEGCVLLTSAALPASVTSVGDSAFKGCAALASATLSGLKTIGDAAFSGCTSLSSVTFGTALTAIGASAFEGCTSLASASLKTGVVTIADAAFSGCTALNAIDLPYATLTYVGVSSFAGCPLTGNKFVYSIKNGEVTLERYTDDATEVVIADTVGGKKLSTVAASAFLGKTTVTKITIGANVKKLGASAFAGLVKLAKVETNDTLAEIGANAFDGCVALTAVTLPDALLTIGARAFADTSIVYVEIPANVGTLSATAFDGSDLEEIEVDAANKTYSAIGALLFEVSTRTLLRAYGTAAEVEVPTSAGIIGESAFAGRTALEKVTLPTTVTKIRTLAFSGCTALETVVIPDSVTLIGDDAFKNCAKLTVQVFSYSAYAYDYCKSRSIPVTVVSTDVPPTKMTLVNLVIGIGNTTQIQPVFTPSNATCTMTYASSNTKIVSIDANGKIKGKKLGKAKIYVMTDNGLLASCTVRVKAAPRKVTLVAKSATLGVGQTFDLEAELPDGTGGTIAYTSSDELIATVDEAGIVTAVGIGSCTVTAKTYNKKSAKCKITVLTAPTALTVGDDALTLGIGQKQTVSWTLDNGQNASALTFASDNPTVATVSASGRVKARKQGFATITLTAYNGLTETVDVIVLKAPTSLSVGSTSVTLYAKQTFEIPVKLTSGSTAGLTYKTSRSSIATISASGVITAKKYGTVTITVQTHNGLKKKITVRIKNAPTKLKLNTYGGTLGVGDSFRLKPSFNAGAGAVMTYTSSDAAIASVDEDGDVVGLAPGDATITATTHNGLSRTCTLTICAAPASLAVAVEEVELGKGETYTIVPVIKDTNGEDYAARVFYKTSASGIATVTSKGKVTGKSSGTVTITAYTYNGYQDTVEVTVKGRPTGITLNKTSGTLPVGANYQLVYKLKGTNAGGTVTFSSSNPFICAVTDTGYLTGVSAGTAVITAKTYNGYKVKCTVTVK